jgi:hypothetical protein
MLFNVFPVVIRLLLLLLVVADVITLIVLVRLVAMIAIMCSFFFKEKNPVIREWAKERRFNA